MKSNNYKILKELISKSKQFKPPKEMDYIIIYSFLFKYCSDTLKDYLSYEIKDEELTLDEAYKFKKYQNNFKSNALNIFGFYIKDPQAFFDEIINNNFNDISFLQDFFTIFPQNIIFNSNNEKNYFNTLFKIILEKINLDKYKHDEKINSIIKKIIFSISKLNTFEDDLTFTQAFELISNSKLMNIKCNGEYISQLLSALISSQKNYIAQVYDPFFNNGDYLIKLANECKLGLNEIYGKEEDKLTYCFTIVKLYLHNFNLDNVYLKQENAFNSIDIDGSIFDVILSKIPIIKIRQSSNENQSLEMAKRIKRKEIEEILLKSFNISNDSFIQNHELNMAFNNLIDEITYSDDLKNKFDGEYESLVNNQFLFLINLIDCLKEDGLMAISISQNFLFKKNLKLLRKYLVHKKNYIDTIISLPDEFEKPSLPEVIIIFKKNRVKKDILFIDMSKDYSTQKYNSTFSGFKRKNTIFDSQTVARICDVFSKRLVIDKFSKVIGIDEISENKFNLLVSQYINTFEGEFFNLEQLSEEKKIISIRRDKLNSQIKKLMDELKINM